MAIISYDLTYNVKKSYLKKCFSLDPPLRWACEFSLS